MTTGELSKFVRRAFLYAAAGIALLSLALSFAPYIKDRLTLDVNKEIENAVQAELGKRLQPVSTLGLVGGSGAQELDRRLRELEDAVKALGTTQQGQRGRGQ
jgi:hypothetical protein